MKCGVSRPLAAGNVARIPRSTAARAATAEAAPVSAEVADMCINTIRFLAIDAVNKANSGHPGAPMGCAPMSFVLFNEAMKYNPKNPSFLNRDRFVLSAGHASMLQYAMMHLSGFDSVTVRSFSLTTCRGSLQFLVGLRAGLVVCARAVCARCRTGCLEATACAEGPRLF